MIAGVTTNWENAMKSGDVGFAQQHYKPHFLLYEVASVIRWVIPYKYRKTLEVLFKLMKNSKPMFYGI